MAIVYDGALAVFHDEVSVEDAEALLQWAQANPYGKADLSACTHIHPADLQVLMAARIQVRAWPQDEQFKIWLTSALVP